MLEYLYGTISSSQLMRNQSHWKLCHFFPWVPALLGLRILLAVPARSRLRNFYFCKLSVIQTVRTWMNLQVKVSLEFTNLRFHPWEFQFPYCFKPRRKVEGRCPHVISQTEQEWDLTVSRAEFFWQYMWCLEPDLSVVWPGEESGEIAWFMSCWRQSKSPCGGERMKKAHSVPPRGSSHQLLYHCMQ